MTGAAQGAPASERRRLFFSPLDPTFTADPYPHYRRLREEDPVHRSAMGMWFVARHDHVTAALRDRRLSSGGVLLQLERKNQMLRAQKVSARQPANIDALIASARNWFVFKDPPDHARLRRLVTKAFHRRAVEEMRPYIRGWVETLIDGLKPQGGMDLMPDFAKLVPMNVIATMVGVPKKDFAEVAGWISKLARVFDPLVSLGEFEAIDRAAFEITRYLEDLIAERRSAPQADLLSALIAARDEQDRLSEEELVAVTIVTFGAGEESTVSMIGNGVLALLRHPEQMADLRAHPELMAAAVEELLRYDAPLQMTARIALEDLEIGGKLIRKGDTVFLLFGAANRDPERFEDPDRLSWRRSEPAQQAHLSFGDGFHACFGAPLARIQAEESFRLLLAKLPGLALAGEEPRWREHSVIRRMTSLPLTFATKSKEGCA